jgi:hypothetical protein
VVYTNQYGIYHVISHDPTFQMELGGPACHWQVPGPLVGLPVTASGTPRAGHHRGRGPRTPTRTASEPEESSTVSDSTHVTIFNFNFTDTQTQVSGWRIESNVCPSRRLLAGRLGDSELLSNESRNRAGPAAVTVPGPARGT